MGNDDSKLKARLFDLNSKVLELVREGKRDGEALPWTRANRRSGPVRPCVGSAGEIRGPTCGPGCTDLPRSRGSPR